MNIPKNFKDFLGYAQDGQDHGLIKKGGPGWMRRKIRRRAAIVQARKINARLENALTSNPTFNRLWSMRRPVV